MTDQEISKYINIDRIPEYMSGPSRALVEYIASCQEEVTRRMRARLKDVSALIDEKSARLEELRKNAFPARTEKEIAREILNQRLRLLKSARWIIVSQSIDRGGPKCSCCDDEGMLVFTAPDGQTVRKPCRCRERHVLTYCAAEAKLVKTSLTAVCLRFNADHWVSLEMIDPDDNVLKNIPLCRKISDIAFTTKEKAEAAIRKMQLNREEGRNA